jgi:cell division protein FtsA
LDVGSRATRLVVCALEKGRMKYLGSGCAESQGWLKGAIRDQKAVAKSIVAALREAEASSGVALGAVVAGIGGVGVRGHNARGALELGFERMVDQDDVNRVMDRASKVQMLADRLLLHVFPQDFVVDRQPGFRDPCGMVGSVLEVNVHLITASEQEHTSLVGAINQAHLLVEETVFEGLAACYAAVRPLERRQGIALVDIGAHSTEIVGYYGDGLYLASTKPVCADHFTADLVRAVGVNFDAAETVKLEFGGTEPEACPSNSYVELPTGEDEEPRQETEAKIHAVLKARAEDLFAFVRSELSRYAMENALLGGVFVTGGGARLPGLLDIGAQILQHQTRYGLPVGILDWPDALNTPEWCVAAGLSMYSARLKTQDKREQEEEGWLGRILR